MNDGPCDRMGHNHLFQSEDVLLQVLSKLPVKTLFRFKCVCRRWRDIISDDPHLSVLHYKQSKCKQPLLFCSSYTKHSDSGIICPTFLKTLDREGETISEFEFKFKLSCAKVVPTRFDLVCIQDDTIVHICNPSTHEIISLPQHGLAICSSSVGFGYVQSTDEYKVVGLLNPDYLKVEDGFSIDPASFTTKCYVFTLGTESRVSSSCASSSSSWAWREVVDSPYHVNYSTPPAFANGAIHWLVLYDSLMDYEVFDGDMIDPNNTIVAFDVESEEFRLVSHPEGCPDLKALQLEHRDYECVELQLVELRGLLSLSCAKGSNMDIWMFKDYYCESGSFYVSGTWVKEYSIDLSVLPKEYQMGYYCTPRDVDDTEVLIETHMKGWGYYHLQSKKFEGFMHNTEMPNLQFSFYTESLRSLKLFKQLAETKDVLAKVLKDLEAMSAELEDLRAAYAERGEDVKARLARVENMKEDVKASLARVEDMKAEVAHLTPKFLGSTSKGDN